MYDGSSITNVVLVGVVMDSMYLSILSRLTLLSLKIIPVTDDTSSNNPNNKCSVPIYPWPQFSDLFFA